jgi:hypothetical protein
MIGKHMDITARRETLHPISNPGGGRDYVITLRATIGRSRDENNTIDIILRYVPDRMILQPENFREYLDYINSLEWKTLEATAVAILDDIGNELVTRWAQVTLRHANNTQTAAEHDIIVEDIQPGWRNDDLLYRLPPV